MTSCFLRAGLRSISRLRQDGFVGMDGFGASGPGGELFEHFGITAQVIVSKAKEMLGR